MRPDGTTSFAEQFTPLFEAEFPRVFRYLNRLCGDRDLAADIAQEAFVKLYRRGSLPDSPGAWVISVAMNLLRNAATTRSRRVRLLTPIRSERVLADPPMAPDREVESKETGRRVRQALDRLSEREREMLLLRAEGFSYREIAQALGINEASVGVLLARAKRAFQTTYEGEPDASR